MIPDLYNLEKETLVPRLEEFLQKKSQQQASEISWLKSMKRLTWI
jgi:hypothetical protein